MSEPKLVEFDTLQRLLKTTYNESGNPFVQIVNKYYENNLINKIIPYWYILLIILVPLSLYIILYVINQNEHMSNNIKNSKKSKKKTLIKTKVEHNTSKHDYVSNYYSMIHKVKALPDEYFDNLIL